MRILVALVSMLALSGGALAQSGDTPAPTRLDLALSALDPVDKGCRMSFLVKNDMASEIEDLSLEIAVFGAGGGLDRMLRLNFGLLIGIAKGSGAGSAVSAILLNTPGEPSSAPTALDGYPLARQGKAQKALKMGLFASVIGDFLSTIVLILLAAPLARYALLIGPVELCAILIFSLTFIGGLSGGSMIKGLIAACFGIFPMFRAK